MIKQYLDYAGLEVLWSKIKAADIANTSEIRDLKKSIAFEANNYSDALQYTTPENVGKIVIINNDEGSHLAGPYVILSEGTVQCLLCNTEAEVGAIQIRLEELVQEIDNMGVSMQNMQNSIDSNTIALEQLKETDETIKDALKSLEESLKNIDLSNYYSKAEVDDLLDDKQDLMDAISKDDIINLS